MEPIAEYRNFWPKDFTPMFLNVNPPQKKIIGYSLSLKGGVVTILSNYPEPNNTQTDFIKIPASETWAGMELNTTATLSIVAVQSKIPDEPHYLQMMAYDTSNIKLNAICRQDFKDRRFQSVQFMRKVKGYDIFVLACRNSIGIMGFHKGKFQVLNYIEAIYRDIIFEIAIYANFMIPVSNGQNEKLKIIEFGLDQLESMIKSKQFDPNGLMNKKNRLLENVFVNQRVKKLKIPQLRGRKRIGISPDGRTLYVGGDGGLLVLKRKTTQHQFSLIRENRSIKLFSLRGTPSGHIVVQMQGSNDLIVFDKTLKNELEFKGYEADRQISTDTFKQPHFSFEGKKMIWFGSNSDLLILDLTSLAQIRVDMFVDPSLNPTPVNAIADFSQDKFLVQYVAGGDSIIVFGEKGREPDTHIVNEIVPKLNQLNSMDVSKSKFFAFLAGWSEDIDDKTGKQFSRGCLTCLKFDKSLQMMAEIELPKRKCSLISKISVSPTHDDVIFTVTDGPLFIIGFNPGQNKFDVLKAIDIKTEISISLFCIHNFLRRIRRHVHLWRQPSDGWRRLR